MRTDSLRSISAVTTIAAFSTFVSVSNAEAAEYCVDNFQGKIAAVDAELGSSLTRLAEIDAALSENLNRQLAVADEILAEASKTPINIERMQELAAEGEVLDREESELKVEGYQLQDRVTDLKGVIPTGLQGELRGCLEATRPANTLVNLAIQSLAVLTTGGASLALPEKALYVDMSAVLNGYPFGGDKSVVNETRNKILDELGLGDPNNDLNKIIVDPGNTVREFLEDLF